MTKGQTQASANGNGSTPDLAAAIAYEDAIRQEADEIWGADTSLTEQKFRQLYQLLRRPIPPGFIQHVGVVTGKPYESDGVRSVQVQIDRLNNVLGPLCWHYADEYSQDGKLCKVTVTVDVEGNPRSFSSWGGMKQASTVGNLYKGSFTNAAKLAIARLGPGWEVYVGAADFDPDTDAAAAEAQAQSPTGTVDGADRKLPAEKVEPLRTAVDAAGLSDHLEMKLRGFGVGSLEELTVEQAVGVWEWARGEVVAS